MLRDRRILVAAIALQTLFLVIGIFGEFWIMTGLCLGARNPWLSSLLGIGWLTLTLSPLLGLLSLWFDRLRLLYVALVILTPAFWIGVMMLANARVLACDGP